MRLRIHSNGVQLIELEEYLKAVVPSEMPALWPLEAVKAQAVAARTYAVYAAMHGGRHSIDGYDLCATQHCQVYNPAKIHPISTHALYLTAGEILTYQGQVINAMYSAACGGLTRTGNVPYLTGVYCQCRTPVRNGHGLGFCQYGAKAMAGNGADYHAILAHYYQGTQLSQLDDVIPVAGDNWLDRLEAAANRAGVNLREFFAKNF